MYITQNYHNQTRTLHCTAATNMGDTNMTTEWFTNPYPWHIENNTLKDVDGQQDN